MRYLSLLVLGAFLVAFNTGWAQGASTAKKPEVKKAAAETAVTEEKPGEKVRPIDLGDNQTTTRENYGVDQPGPAQQGQVYDEDTGLPNVVESDSQWDSK